MRVAFASALLFAGVGQAIEAEAQADAFAITCPSRGELWVRHTLAAEAAQVEYDPIVLSLAGNSMIGVPTRSGDGVVEGRLMLDEDLVTHLESSGPVVIGLTDVSGGVVSMDAPDFARTARACLNGG